MAKKESKKEPKFEEQLDRLKSIVKNLESGETDLEDSVAMFEEGIKLAKVCQDRLQSAEQKIVQLIAIDEDGVHTKPFEEE